MRILQQKADQNESSVSKQKEMFFKASRGRLRDTKVPSRASGLKTHRSCDHLEGLQQAANSNFHTSSNHQKLTNFFSLSRGGKASFALQPRGSALRVESSRAFKRLPPQCDDAKSVASARSLSQEIMHNARAVKSRKKSIG